MLVNLEMIKDKEKVSIPWKMALNMMVIIYYKKKFVIFKLLGEWKDGERNGFGNTFLF